MNTPAKDQVSVDPLRNPSEIGEKRKPTRRMACILIPGKDGKAGHVQCGLSVTAQEAASLAGLDGNEHTDAGAGEETQHSDDAVELGDANNDELTGVERTDELKDADSNDDLDDQESTEAHT